MKIRAVLLFGFMFSTYAHAESIEQVVQETLLASPDVAADADKRRATDYELRQSYSNFWPSVDLSAVLGHQRSMNANTIVYTAGYLDLTRHEFNAGITQSLFSGFNTFYDVRRNSARVRSAAHTVNKTAEDTALQSIQVFLEVLRRQEIIRLAESTLAKHQKIYEQIKSRSDVGIGKKADLAQASGRLALARTNLMSAQGNLRDAHANYQRVVGVFPMQLVKPGYPGAAIPPTLEAAVSLGLANAPAMHSAIADVEAAKAQYDESKSAFYPQLDLEVSTQQDKNLDGVEGDNKYTMALARVKYNLFHGGGDYAVLKEAAWNAQQAAAFRNRAYRQVEENVRLSWNAYLTAQNELRYYRAHRDSSVQTRDSYAKQFDIGQRTLLDLLDSENELFSASSDYVNGQYTVLYGQFRVLNSVGGLLDYLNITPPVEAEPDARYVFAQSQIPAEK